MTPPKWSTPEQEAWLGPWYEKYRAKQSDRAKNWANFFTDLLGEWLDVFPEPRPATVPPIGPLTRDELVIMDQAEAERKKKLENRFKNSLGSTKTGRQAKAEAANVFNAVLKSVTECEKPTRSLQEVEAYSKLYYQRRVKFMVDNRLKAEAEALQAENKALTNGMRVAIAKKEVANLYEGETNEVKAEVRKYIEDAKMHRDNEKEGMWSEDDYGRNIEKLAAIVNKFLTGLADATGFSFSLLAGGPSPELGGLIDVYSFHVGQTKYGNNFSQTYPEFESAIMSPFKDYLHRVYPEATATLKARLGSASDLDHDDGGDRSPISAGLGISHDDTSGQVMFNTSSQADKVPDINLPENSTDINWPDIDDSFWEGLSAQVDAFEASGGNPNLPCLPPYPQAASALESPSAPITPPPGLPPNTSPSPPITPPPGLPRNISQPAPIVVPLQDLPTPLQNSPALPPTTTLSSESTRIQAPSMDLFQPTPILAPEDSPMLPPAAVPSSAAPVSSPSTIPDQQSQPLAPVASPSTIPDQQSQPPAPVECSVLRRTGRVSVPSSRNVIANSIGDNRLIASKRRGPAGEDGVSGHKKKQRV
ncbi:uncharacterized protein EDB91DRAFT_1351358 [Suillus paluster]|uniref:uncharacterized protein n=1 Tax=Suillus paluster TaxID=48578 RepID=UPI001B870D71|nr:uncharacterized protein EDB91DRAFT_1351358 [Suillus paluster]KAG1722594.1 hypothetical protein EDB91DRAFT_1351358 [Suillus paluster]